MANTEAVLFIDANQYLPLYRMVAGKKLLDSLEEQKAHIFVTSQIVDEVYRNKLRLAQVFFSEQFKLLDPTQVGVPDHLFGISDETTREIRKDLLALREQAEKVKAQLTQLASNTLSQISRSEDEVSKRLKGLFDQAAVPSADELQRARDRKERGNPPGKDADPLGDQITWEQLLSYCKGGKRLWIITNDKDYHTEYERTLLLNPLLRRDLTEDLGASTEVYCFNTLLAGVNHFGQNAGVKAEKLPTPDEVKEIEKEEKEFPFLGWLDSSSDLGASMVVRNAYEQRRRHIAAIAASDQGGWHPGMMEEGKEITGAGNFQTPKD